MTTPTTGYAARRKARHDAKWTLGEIAVTSRAARKRHHDALVYAKLAASLAGPMPAPATERDAAVYLVAHRMLDDYAARHKEARDERRRLIHLRRHARAIIAATRWTPADQRRLDREEEDEYQRMEDRAWRDTHERAYGED